MEDEIMGPGVDAGQAADFLDWFQPGEPWPVTHATPDWRDVRTDWLSEADDVRVFVEAQRNRGLFYTVARVRSGVTTKPKKGDLVDTRHLQVDLDPPKNMDPSDFPAWLDAKRAELCDDSRVPPPSYLGCSGSGLHLLWKLDAPLDIGGDAQLEMFEQYNAGLLAALDQTDGTWNADRLLRIPGSINWPNAKKRKDGRAPSHAYILDLNERVYGLSDFMPTVEHPATRQKSKPVKAAETQPRRELRRLNNPVELEEWDVPPWALAVIVHGTDPEQPGRWDGDRSRALFAICCELVRRDVPEELIVGIITDKAWDISAHVLDQRRPADYAWRQVEQAKANAAKAADTFQCDKDGKPYANQQNVRLALSKMGVTVRHDTFADRMLVEGVSGLGPHLDDAALDRIWLHIDEAFRFRPTWDFFVKVVVDAARRSAFHPVRDYLDAVRWDGERRIDGWLSTYGGARDTPYTRAVGALMLVAAVRRVRQPGVKFDEMLVLESKQGTNKSSALRLLATRDEWFTDDLPLNAETKVVIERLAGRWIVEAAELKGMRKGEVEHLKSALSRQFDRARMSYARLSANVPRQCVIFGTTNSERYLRDLTGNRRFWPVRVDGFDLERLRGDVDQLWAEASAREAAGDSIRLDPSLWSEAEEAQDNRRIDDPFTAALAAAVGDQTGKMSGQAVWEVLRIPAGMRTQEHNARVGDAMRELGFERKKLRFGGPSEWGYARGTEEEQRQMIVLDDGRRDEFPGDPY